MEKIIPKKIHYCWFGPDPLPKLVINCLKTWSEHLPDYEIYLWNEKNSPMELPFVREAYVAKKYAFVSDYIRFWALNNHGGIYLDTDMFVLRSFNTLLNNDVFFAWETEEKKNISCGVIGAVPGHSFISYIMNHYEGLHFKVSSIPDLVIPRIIRKCFADYTLKDEIRVLPFDCFYPFPYEEKENVREFMRFRTENTYAIHLWNVSWGTFKDKLRDKILYHLRTQWRKAK